LTKINTPAGVFCYSNLQTHPMIHLFLMVDARLRLAEMAREAIQKLASIKAINAGSVVLHPVWRAKLFGVLNQGENHG
jgi:hypothetical protein